MKELVSLKTVYVNGCELSVGNKIHVKPFRGIYWIVSLTETHMVITCGKWLYMPGRSSRHRTLPITDFHAFHNEYKGWQTFINS